MKKRLFDLSGHSKNGFLRPVIALVVAAGLIAATPVVNGVARAVDLEKECRLSVSSTSSTDEEWVKDISETNLLIDLYKVADAKALAFSDSYSFETTDSFQEISIPSELDTDALRLLSQQAARLAVGGENKLTPIVTGADINTTIESLDAGGKLGTGLYLLIARGADLEEYIEEIETAEGEKTLVSVAYSSEYKYMFSPELIAFPTKEPDENGEVKTSNLGDWLYDQAVALKAERSVAYGSLEISKTLLTFAKGYSADFVFDIEAVLKGKVVYSNVVSIKFTSPGQKSVLIEKIPVGAEVTVTEVYTGASYKLISDGTVNTVINPGETATVSFINDYENGKSSGAITNHFTYDGTGWTWEQKDDNTSDVAQ